MVTAPSNLWGRVCKCVFLSSDLQIVPFIAFVTVKIKVPGWPALQITESALGAAAGWEPLEGSEPCSRLYTLTISCVQCGLIPKNRKLGPWHCHSEPFVPSVTNGDVFLQAVFQDPSIH